MNDFHRKSVARCDKGKSFFFKWIGVHVCPSLLRSQLVSTMRTEVNILLAEYWPSSGGQTVYIPPHCCNSKMSVMPAV